MSTVLAAAVLAAGFTTAAGLLAYAIHAQRRHQRAKARARLPEHMHLLGDHHRPDPRWARRLINDIHALPTTTRERGNQ